MIGYVTIGVKDMEKAKKFYTDLLTGLGAKVLADMGRIAFIGESMGQPCLAVCIPVNEEEPQPGNGNMVAINPGSKAKVDEFYRKAIALGGSCEGAPGQRINDVFYGAYFRDPDGNKVAFFQFG
jgi:catechol 2,3-dioxygenase-like lactoylglutathione lyase family enzyme